MVTAAYSRQPWNCTTRVVTDQGSISTVTRSPLIAVPVSSRVDSFRSERHAREGVQKNLIAAVDDEGKLTAWDFTDLSLPRTEADGTPMLASVQVGIQPANPDATNGSQSAGEIYGVDNQRIVANLINLLLAAMFLARPRPCHLYRALRRRRARNCHR